jgi:hypothetical protein
MAKKQLKYNMKLIRGLHPEYVKGILFAGIC